MSFIAELSIQGNLRLFEEIFEYAPNADCLYEDVHYVTDEDNNTHYVFFWWVSGCEFDNFEQGLDHDPTVVEYQSIVALNGRGLYRIVTPQFSPEQPLLFEIFREYNITTLETRRDANGIHLRARMPTREALQTVYDVGSSIADTFEVKRLYAAESTDPETSSVAGPISLTQKQRTALERALARGYFETPSQVTLDELAEEFDVTPQALSRHIRTGVKKVVKHVVGSASEGHYRKDT